MQIEVKDLNFYYNRGTVFEKKALDNINLQIDKGEFVGLIGQTGSGKSTLIQHLNALLAPESGAVLLDGADIHADKTMLKNVRRRVGLVFQYPEHQLFESSVYKDVAFGPENMGLSDIDVDTRVKDALRIVGLGEDLHEKSPFELSGGQKRRAAIAGVLAMRPDVLILDEPTAGLDPRGREDIFDKIQNMRNELGITIIFVSHSMEDIARLVSRIVVINDGRIILDGTPAEVFKHIELLECNGLSAPQPSYLVNALNNRGFDLPDDIYTIDAAHNAIVTNLRAAQRTGAAV